MGSLGIFRPLFKLNLSTRNQVGGQIQTWPCVRVMEAAAAFQVTKTRYEHSQGLKFVAQFRSSDPFLFIPQSARPQRAALPGRGLGDWSSSALQAEHSIPLLCIELLRVSPASRALIASLCLLFFFSSLDRFRLMCNKIITHKMFDHVVLVIIFLNCITIAMERPKIEPHSAVSF